MTNFEIRQTTERDVPGILDLIRELAGYEPEPDGVGGSVARARRRRTGWVRRLFLQLLDLARPPRTLSRRSFRATRGARERVRPRVARGVGKHRAGTRLRANGMGGARLERSRDPVLPEARRRTEERVDGVSINTRWNCK